METIPKIVLDAAREEGFNCVTYLCTYNGAEAYSAGIKDENGMYEPLGMPFCLLLKNNKVRYANDQENEDITKFLLGSVGQI